MTSHSLGRTLRGFVAALLVACQAPEAVPTLPPNTVAFGVFGDGPYSDREVSRVRQVLGDMDRSDLKWIIHVGDIFGERCDDGRYKSVRNGLNELRHPVMYTPGDNEWTDCGSRRRGQYRPLERLAFLRTVFFPVPALSLGGERMPVESQAADSTYREYVENVRWTSGRVLFATVHVVGSANGQDDGPATTPVGIESARRTAAAIQWMEEAFAKASRDSLQAVVIAMHAQLGLSPGSSVRRGYEQITARLEALTMGYSGQVLLIHGDSHTQRVDHPFEDSATGAPLERFTRLETFGSPQIGWVRVLVDTVGTRFSFEARAAR